MNAEKMPHIFIKERRRYPMKEAGGGFILPRKAGRYAVVPERWRMRRSRMKCVAKSHAWDFVVLMEETSMRRSSMH